MEIMRQELVFIKTFLNCFNIEYNKRVSEVLGTLKNIGKISLYNDGCEVGTLSYYTDTYTIFASLDNFLLTATITTSKKEEKFTKVIDYELHSYNNSKIVGVYKINNNGSDCNPNLRNKNTIKNSFSVIKNGKEISYFKFFSVKNSTYIADRMRNEYVNFSNDILSHGMDNERIHVAYDFNNDIINYTHLFKEEGQPLTYAGGYALYKDADEKDFCIVRKNYRKVIEEFDSRYKFFIDEQRTLLDEFDDGLFDRFIDNALIILTEEEKFYIFNKNFPGEYSNKLTKQP